MRKLSLALLLVLGLLLVSCGMTMTPSDVTPGAAEDGITLKTQFSVYASDVPFIQFSIENNSGDMAEYGTEWTIERLEDDTWYSIPFKPDTAWTQPLYILGNGGTATDTAYLSVLDHKLKNGTYRIVKEINDTFYTAEFTVGDSPVGEDAPYGYQPMDTLPSNYTAEMAAKDGVVLIDASSDLSQFFYEISIGMNTELRYAESATDQTLEVTDLTAEFKLGQCRIRYTIGQNSQYFSYLISDGEQIALSAYPTWQEDDPTRVLLPELAGNVSALDALQPQVETAIEQYRRAAFWSQDGMQLLTLHADADSPLEFGLSRLYEGGGGSGSLHTITTPGMKAIRSALWTDENTVMLICDVENTMPDLSEMTGYVFFDTAEGTVTSYTQSWYEPQIDADGTIIIPE